MELKDKVALVTGSSSGIGRNIAISFAKEGAKLIINDIREQKELEETVIAVEKAGSSAFAVRADVSNKKEVDDLVKSGWEKFGKIDILVNNAGIAFSTPFIEVKEEEWDQTINTNLKGTFLCSQAVAKKMIKSGIKGKIINMTSINAFQAEKTRVPYDSSKGGISALTKTMAAELGGYGINVNAIAPGVVSGTNIDVDDNFFNNKDIVNKILDRTPLNRMGTVEDCSNVAVFLASNRSDFIHGEIIVLDGGLTIVQF